MLGPKQLSNKCSLRCDDNDLPAVNKTPKRSPVFSVANFNQEIPRWSFRHFPLHLYSRQGECDSLGIACTHCSESALLPCMPLLSAAAPIGSACLFFFFFHAACTKVGTSIHIQQLPGPLPDLLCHLQWCPCHSLPSAALGSLPLVFIALSRIGKVMKPDPLRARWVTWAAQLFERVLCPLRFPPSGACMGGSRQAMSWSSWRF